MSCFTIILLNVLTEAVVCSEQSRSTVEFSTGFIRQTRRLFLYRLPDTPGWFISVIRGRLADCCSWRSAQKLQREMAFSQSRDTNQYCSTSTSGSFFLVASMFQKWRAMGENCALCGALMIIAITLMIAPRGLGLVLWRTVAQSPSESIHETLIWLSNWIPGSDLLLWRREMGRWDIRRTDIRRRGRFALRSAAKCRTITFSLHKFIIY